MAGFAQIGLALHSWKQTNCLGDRRFSTRARYALPGIQTLQAWTDPALITEHFHGIKTPDSREVRLEFP